MLHWVSSVVGLYTYRDQPPADDSMLETSNNAQPSSRSPTPEGRGGSQGWILLHSNGEIEVDETGSVAFSETDQSRASDGESLFGYDNGAEYGDSRVVNEENVGAAANVVVTSEEEEESDGDDDAMGEENEPIATSAADSALLSENPIPEPSTSISAKEALAPSEPTSPPSLSLTARSPNAREYPPPEFPPTLFAVWTESSAFDPNLKITKFGSVYQPDSAKIIPSRPPKSAAQPSPYEIHTMVRKTIDRLTSSKNSAYNDGGRHHTKSMHPILARMRNHEFLVRKLGKLDAHRGRGHGHHGGVGKRAGLGLGNKGSGPALGRTAL